MEKNKVVFFLSFSNSIIQSHFLQSQCSRMEFPVTCSWWLPVCWAELPGDAAWPWPACTLDIPPSWGSDLLSDRFCRWKKKKKKTVILIFPILNESVSCFSPSRLAVKFILELSKDFPPHLLLLPGLTQTLHQLRPGHRRNGDRKTAAKSVSKVVFIGNISLFHFSLNILLFYYYILGAETIDQNSWICCDIAD